MKIALSQADIAQVYDDFHDENEISLENLMDAADISIGSYRDIMQLKKVSLSHLETKDNSGAVAGPGMHADQPAPVEEFIDLRSNNESTIIIDQQLLFAIFTDQSEIICNFIKQLDSIPEEGILNVIIDLQMGDLNYFAMEAGIMISNLIKRSKGTKVFNFGAEASIVDLMMAMCCDEVYVGDFASVSITKADNGANITRYIVPVYKFIVRATYKHWIEKGLFTPEEVSGLFTSEADNSIQLLSDEIRRRIQKNVSK